MNCNKNGNHNEEQILLIHLELAERKLILNEN
jgi:hypothetical protein